MFKQLLLILLTLCVWTMETRPCGSWKSPITSSMLTESAVRLGEIVIDGEDIYWSEMRPEEKGRYTIVRNGEDILPPPYNARTRVHEYGGGSFTVSDGTLYFINDKDQGLYRKTADGTIEKICGEEGKRYANPLFDPKRGILYAIQEEHRSEHDVINTLVKIGEKVELIHEGHDFYSMPALHPDGTHLAFLTWDHPNMPWDGSTLWVGSLTSDGSLEDVKKVAGGEKESIFQPQWSPDAVLHYVSDRTDWWNLYRMGEPLCPMEAEFGQPLWVFKMSTYTFINGGKIACVYTDKGTDHLAILDPDKKRLETLDLPFTCYDGITSRGNTLYFLGSSPTEMKGLIEYDIETTNWKVLRKSKEANIDPAYLSLPETIEFPTEGNQKAYAFYYPPTNKDYLPSDLPPLIVRSHGGPTAQVSNSLSLEIQFWTSRGFALLDVNYGGSTGFGREYRNRLKGNWGIVDVDDCCNGALYLAEKGLVDKNRMAIKGGSAGGYTTLAALTFRNVFKAGASYYGVSDLEALVADTHKFESQYLEGLIGPYPEAKNRYVELSPIHHTDQLSCPVILFQGEEDKIVPPSQAEMMFDALNQKKIPVAYLLFKGEQHGFRAAENIQRALESELYFYSKIFGFTPDDTLKPITIHNLP
ncbi:MAG: S9 family peptidase [Chlamydiia bacterium]|nr:S9 family peptidase [Chlamydiia bacterium]